MCLCACVCVCVWVSTCIFILTIMFPVYLYVCAFVRVRLCACALPSPRCRRGCVSGSSPPVSTGASPCTRPSPRLRTRSQRGQGLLLLLRTRLFALPPLPYSNKHDALNQPVRHPRGAFTAPLWAVEVLQVYRKMTVKINTRKDNVNVIF